MLRPQLLAPLLEHVFVNRSGFGVLALDRIKDCEIVECVQSIRMGGPVDAALDIDDSGIEFFRILIAVFTVLSTGQDYRAVPEALTV